MEAGSGWRLPRRMQVGKDLADREVFWDTCIFAKRFIYNDKRNKDMV